MINTLSFLDITESPQRQEPHFTPLYLPCNSYRLNGIQAGSLCPVTNLGRSRLFQEDPAPAETKERRSSWRLRRLNGRSLLNSSTSCCARSKAECRRRGVITRGASPPSEATGAAAGVGGSPGSRGSLFCTANARQIDQADRCKTISLKRSALAIFCCRCRQHLFCSARSAFRLHAPLRQLRSPFCSIERAAWVLAFRS